MKHETVESSVCVRTKTTATAVRTQMTVVVIVMGVT